MKELIQRGVPLYCKTGIDSDLVYLVAKKGKTLILKYLIEIKAPWDKPQLSSQVTPLGIAAYQGNLECVKLLIESGANMNHKCKKGSTPLYLAAQKQHYGVVEYLVSINGVIDYMEELEDNNALIYGIQKNDIELVQILLANEGLGSRVKGEPPLHIATRANLEHMVELLSIYIDNIDIESPKDALTPFMFAVRNGFLGVADILLQMGANPKYIDPHGYTIIDIVQQEDNNLAKKYLRERDIWDGIKTEPHEELKFNRLLSKQDSMMNIALKLTASGKGQLKKEKRSLRPLPPMRKLRPIHVVKGPYVKKRINIPANIHRQTKNEKKIKSEVNVRKKIKRDKSIDSSFSFDDFSSDEEELCEVYKRNKVEIKRNSPTIIKSKKTIHLDINSPKDKNSTVSSIPKINESSPTMIITTKTKNVPINSKKKLVLSNFPPEYLDSDLPSSKQHKQMKNTTSTSLTSLNKYLDKSTKINRDKESEVDKNINDNKTKNKLKKLGSITPAIVIDNEEISKKIKLRIKHNQTVDLVGRDKEGKSMNRHIIVNKTEENIKYENLTPKLEGKRKKKINSKCKDKINDIREENKYEENAKYSGTNLNKLTGNQKLKQNIKQIKSRQVTNNEDLMKQFHTLDERILIENIKDLKPEEWKGPEVGEEISLPIIGGKSTELIVEQKNKFKKKRGMKKVSSGIELDKSREPTISIEDTNYREGKRGKLKSRSMDLERNMEKVLIVDEEAPMIEIDNQRIPLVGKELLKVPIRFGYETDEEAKEEEEIEDKKRRKHQKHEKHQKHQKHRKQHHRKHSKSEILNSNILEVPNTRDSSSGESSRERRVSISRQMRRASREYSVDNSPSELIQRETLNPNTPNTQRIIRTRVYSDAAANTIDQTLEDLERHKDTDIGVRKLQRKSICKMKERRNSYLSIEELADLHTIRNKLDLLKETKHQTRKNIKKNNAQSGIHIGLKPKLSSTELTVPEGN